MGDAITLTAAQAEQLTTFPDEKDHEASVLLGKAKHLGAVEAVLLDGEGNSMLREARRGSRDRRPRLHLCPPGRVRVPAGFHRRRQRRVLRQLWRRRDAVGTLAPIVDGYIGCIVIRPDGSRVLARVVPDPLAQRKSD
jgi:hypothetical protein